MVEWLNRMSIHVRRDEIMGNFETGAVDYVAPRLRKVRGEKWALGLEPNVELTNVEILGTSYFGFGSSMRGGMIRSYVEVGRFSRIGRDVSLGLGNHDYNLTSVAPYFGFPPSGKGRAFASQNPKRRVIVGNDVWIGDGVKINTGVKIGDGAIVGAQSMVTKDVPPYSIVGGIPARHIKWRFEPELIEQLVDVQWWKYEPIVLKTILSADPAESLERINSAARLPLADLPRIVVKSSTFDPKKGIRLGGRK